MKCCDTILSIEMPAVGMTFLPCGLVVVALMSVACDDWWSSVKL
jgi:hypothetical protein